MLNYMDLFKVFIDLLSITDILSPPQTFFLCVQHKQLCPRGLSTVPVHQLSQNSTQDAYFFKVYNVYFSVFDTVLVKHLHVLFFL